MAKQMEIAMQDDQTIIFTNRNRDIALDQFRAMGGTHVRINVVHKIGEATENQIHYGTQAPIKLYDKAIDAIRAHGLIPQVALLWKQRRDPAFMAAWMRNVAMHFGAKVNRYSVLNEPDYYLYYDEGSCDEKSADQFRKRFQSRMVMTFGEWRAKGTLVKGTNLSLRVACQRFLRGIEYRKIFNASAKAIHSVRPRAEILAGETSARPGLDWFFRGMDWKKLKGAFGYAHHPYQLHDLTPAKRTNGYGVGNLKDLDKLVPLPIYLTEFGYPHPNSSMDKRTLGRRARPKEIAKAYATAWRVARRSGARQMLQYQWFLKPDWRTEYWETALNRIDDGRTTQAYRALKKLILSW